MWSAILLGIMSCFIPLPTLSQVANTELPVLTQSCSNAEEMARCRDTFFNATNFVPTEKTEAFCKKRAAFSICLEAAVCTCQYPTDHPLLENAYKDIMRNNYEFKNESCETFNTGYSMKPGINCSQTSQNTSDPFRIVQTTSEQPFIMSLKENCSAIGFCFTKRDRDFEADLYNKSLSAFCRDYEVFLKCFEMKACECNMHTDQSMLLVDDFEKRLFTETCSIITGTQTVIPEITCGGTCSLSDPGVTCTQEFDMNIAVSKGDEHFCSHLVAYAECYERLVCECSLYQEQNAYSAVAIAKYTYEVKSDCRRFPEVVFPSEHSGFMCPNNTNIEAEYKILKLNTSQDDFVKAEEKLCPGVAECFARFDTNGSLALYNKDLKAICQAMNEEILCLEKTTCECGTLHARFTSTLRSKRDGLNAVCGQGVLELPLPKNCVDKAVCTTPAPLQNCTNILNKQAQDGEDSQKVTCENYFNHGQCIKDISCSCGLINNRSSNTAINIYKLLNKNAASYDSMGCSAKLNKTETRLACQDNGAVAESERRLNLTWSLSSEKSQLVTECPSLKDCFDREESINEEALYTFDYKRVCRNQLNTIKCMENSFCKCGLDKDESKTTALQEKIISHNTECSKYSPFGKKQICDEDVCLKAKTADVCSKQLTSTDDAADKCIEYTSYLFCALDVACTCDLLKNGTEASAEMVYRNVTQVLYLMLSHRCSLGSVPVYLFQAGFECFDMTTALPVQMGTLHISFAKAAAVQQWSDSCPAVVTCASQYDKNLTEALIVKNFDAVCLSTLTMIQCSRRELKSCSLLSTTQVAQFVALLVSKHVGCAADNATETELESISFTTQAVVSVNSSKLQGESTKGGYNSSVTASPPSRQMVSALLIMVSVWILKR